MNVANNSTHGFSTILMLHLHMLTRKAKTLSLLICVFLIILFASNINLNCNVAVIIISLITTSLQLMHLCTLLLFTWRKKVNLAVLCLNFVIECKNMLLFTNHSQSCSKLAARFTNCLIISAHILCWSWMEIIINVSCIWVKFLCLATFIQRKIVTIQSQ